MNPDGCNVRVRSRNVKCTLKGTGAFPIGIIGTILCSMVFVSCVALAGYFWRHGRFVTSEMWVQLAGISVITMLNIAFWVCFILTAIFQFPWWYSRGFVRPGSGEFYTRVTDAVYWIDKIVLVLSCLVHLGFLYQLVFAVHRSRRDFLLVLFGLVAGLLLASMGLAISFYVDRNLTNQLVAFFSINYGFHILESVMFLVYGLLLLRSHWSTHGLDRKCVKTIVLLVLLVIPNIGRLIVTIFTWLRHYFSVGDSSAVFYAGLDYYLVVFSSHSSARLFYVFGFLIPDTLPYIVLLLLLFDSVHTAVIGEEKRHSEIGAPLLERTASIPSRYEV